MSKIKTLTMEHDKIEQIGKSVIQHGKLSDRVYLIKLNPEDAEEVIQKIESLAENNGYTKIFTKVPITLKKQFLESQYRQEGEIPSFFNGTEAVVFMSKFLDKDRQIIQNQQTIDNVLSVAKSKQSVNSNTLPDGFQFREAIKDDVQNITEIYHTVFETYPFPIHNPDYVADTMDANVRYFLITKGDKIASIASAEMDKNRQNVEMTDFATYQKFRGNDFAHFILWKMEEAMSGSNIHTAYTIARSVSYGMNVTFAKCGYTFSGTLINNTQISGNIESMNIWFKSLS